MSGTSVSLCLSLCSPITGNIYGDPHPELVRHVVAVLPCAFQISLQPIVKAKRKNMNHQLGDTCLYLCSPNKKKKNPNHTHFQIPPGYCNMLKAGVAK